MNTQTKRLTEGMSDTEKVNFLFEKYKSKFSGGLHDTLWQLLVNKTFGPLTNKNYSFVPAIQSGFTRLGIAERNEGGYSPCPTAFKSRKHDENEKICIELSLEVFGVNEDEVEEITLSSICKQDRQ